MVNCAPDPESCALKAFEFVPFEQAVADAAAECAKPISTAGWYQPANPNDPHEENKG
ncbi:MAG: hypothetical protein HBSAPP03_25390 [Phycisphaerae bacterium]|nr:MAG: hypothetical protein HBSAPP03_25390 [Phycisphaerae bacterium]